jgi:FkbM family methyltransferase
MRAGMVLLDVAKRVIHATGLRPSAGAILRAYAKLRPNHTCTRDGIRYQLDLSQVIDIGIFVGGWEPQTMQILRNNVLPGQIVIEVGSNIGAHTLTLASLVGRNGKVYAFEPTDYAQAKLRRNLSINPHLIERVEIRSNMVTNHDLATPIRDLRASWKLDINEYSPEQVVAPAISLDAFVSELSLSTVDFIKIDVDGYDYKVLQGARALIERFRPQLLVELCEYALNRQGDSVRDIFALLTALGYRATLENGDIVAEAANVLPLIGDRTSVNCVFSPDDAPPVLVE